MQIKRLNFDQLSNRQTAAWSELQRALPAFESPFFRPEYCAVVSAEQSDVEVAVFHQDGREVGFFPYQRTAGNVARPVGLQLCDFQGVVVETAIEWNVQDLLKACDLKAWAFDHLVASQSQVADFHWTHCESPVVDLSNGFDVFRNQKRQAGTDSLEQALRKGRKLEREVGSLRLVEYCDDPSVVETVIEWKRDQYRRMGSVDHLAESWTRDLLRRISGVRLENFSGMVSALYAGESLVAAHLGIRSDRVLHCWFPTYNREFQKYSPGMVFWLLIAQKAADLGIERIDLGKGDERYKQSLKTGDEVLAEGAVDLRFARNAVKRGLHHARNLVRNSPFASPLKAVVRSMRRAVRGNAETAETPRPTAESETRHSQKESMALTCE